MVPRTAWAFALPCIAAVRRLLSAFVQFCGVPPVPYKYRSPVASSSASGEALGVGAVTALAAGLAGVLLAFFGVVVTLGGGVAFASSAGFSGVVSARAGCWSLVPLFGVAAPWAAVCPPWAGN